MKPSPTFEQWFGASKVVDADGSPLVVYHGTNTEKDFTSFRTDIDGIFGPGAYFTTDAKRAAGYAEKEDDFGRIIPAYLSLRNPLVVTADYDAGLLVDFDSPAVPMLRQIFGDKADSIIGKLIFRESGLGPRVRRRIESLGHDGLIVQWEGSKDYVAFDPEQIKSAIGNNGDFNVANTDIRFSLADIEDPAPAPQAQQAFTCLEELQRINGQIRLPGVTGDVVAVRNKFSSIYSWSGDGTGRTREALRQLKSFGGVVVAHDVGDEGTASRNYWEKMYAEGLVDELRDDEVANDPVLKSRILDSRADVDEGEPLAPQAPSA